MDIMKAFGSLKTLFGQARGQMDELRNEVDGLQVERELHITAPLPAAEVLAYVVDQVDRAGAEWLKGFQSRLDLVGYRAVNQAYVPPLGMQSPPTFGESYVVGLYSGGSALCYLLRDQVLAGFARAVAERNFNGAGLSVRAREIELARIDERLEELRLIEGNMTAEVLAGIDIDKLVDEAAEARRRAASERPLDRPDTVAHLPKIDRPSGHRDAP